MLSRANAASSVSFGDGKVLPNPGLGAGYIYTSAGNYTVTYTVYNNDNPTGVSASTLIDVLAPVTPQLQSVMLLTNGFQFAFPGETGVRYTIQYSTNLAPPVVWNTLQTIYNSSAGLQQITDPTIPTDTRFYRVLAQ